MEEKNIRWGELVGGLLIVGCSIALVISFWAQIAAQPLLKFVLFNGVTAALFGVGMYTDRRWKIHTTSHGILIIATLMVPLNFLAIAAFTQASPATDLLSLSGEAISLVVFAMLVYFAGRIFVPADATLLAVAVIVPCLMQLLIRRFAGPTTPFVYVYALAAVPILTYLITSSVAVWRHWAPVIGELGEATSLTELEANRVLMFLGVTTAAALMAIALLLHNVPPLAITLHWLSPLVALCGLPAVLVGLLFWRRLVDRTSLGFADRGHWRRCFRGARHGRRSRVCVAGSGYAVAGCATNGDRDVGRRRVVWDSGRSCASWCCARNGLDSRLLSIARRRRLDACRVIGNQEPLPLCDDGACARCFGSGVRFGCRRAQSLGTTRERQNVCAACRCSDDRKPRAGILVWVWSRG